MGGDMELGGLVWGREVSIYKHRWDGDPAPLFMLASLSPLGPGRGGGAPFPWRAETVVQTGPGPAGARTLIPPPAARFVELSCGTQTTMGIDFIDRDGVSTIGGFAWTQSANQVWPIPQRAGSLVLTTSGAANVTVIFDQGEG
jgi:hypothetical protein